MENNGSLYAVLNDDWVLRGWSNLECALVNWHTNEMEYLPPDERHVLKSCDGRHDFHSALFLPVHHVLLEKYTERGIVRQCREGECTIHPAQAYRRADCPVTKSVLWSLTNNCNFRCRHCYMSAPQRAYKELSRDELFSVLDKLEAANVPDISFTGGEPLLRPELPELLRRMKEKHINFTEIFSNASLVTDEILDEIEAIGYMPAFKVSFDCIGTHNYMRGVPFAEEQTLRGIRTLTRRGYTVIIISSVDSVVLPQIPETLDALIDLGVDSWWISPPVEVGVWKGSQTKSNLNDTISALKNLAKLWVDRGRPIELLLWYFGIFKRKGSEQLHVGNGRLFVPEDYECLACHYYPYVAPDGKVLPCGSYIGTEIAKPLPSLTDMTFAEALNDASLRRYCDMKKDEIWNNSESCRSCAHFPDCGGGCRIAAFTETGDFLHREPTKCALFKGGIRDSFIEYVKELVSHE
ncbi:MAG: radical SAM protein [Lachnospiraceae bacterium]|nr:radical SAM protein [Lachnospiraceae bacterium]